MTRRDKQPLAPPAASFSQRRNALEETREKGSLDRPTIIRAALALLDETGVDGLSTRRLAADLGIKSASLYWHFKDKNELLNEMSGALFEQALRPPNLDGLNFDWTEWLADGARAIRRAALSRRDGAQVMARPRPRAPHAKISFEDNVKTLMRSGLTDMESRLTMQTLRRYAIGAALQEQSTPGGSGIVLTGEEGFEFGLQTFIDGLKVRIVDREKIGRAIGKSMGQSMGQSIGKLRV